MGLRPPSLPSPARLHTTSCCIVVESRTSGFDIRCIMMKVNIGAVLVLLACVAAHVSANPIRGWMGNGGSNYWNRNMNNGRWNFARGQMGNMGRMNEDYKFDNMAQWMNGDKGGNMGQMYNGMMGRMNNGMMGGNMGQYNMGNYRMGNSGMGNMINRWNMNNRNMYWGW